MFKDNRRTVLLGCFLLYIAVNVFFVISNYGAYSIDEFYSLGSANLSVSTMYNRASYINALIRLLSRLFGSSYYIFKMIPMAAGLLSYCCVMYLADKMCSKSGTFWIISLAFTFNGLILFNHLYIRHYVFAEAAYMLSMVFLYRYAAESKTNRIRFLYLAIFVIPNFLYYKFTNDSSGTALLAITLVVLIAVLVQNYLDKIFYNKYLWVIAIVLLGIMEAFVILLKKQMIDYASNATLNQIHALLSFYQTDIFVYVLFLIFANLAVVIAAGSIVIRLFRNRFEDKKMVFLVVYTILPMAAYFLFFFNNSLLRSYIPYMGAGFVILAYFIDSLNKAVWKRALVLLIAINAVFTFYPFPEGLAEFWHEPMIRKEVYIRDYQPWIDEAESAAEAGYTIIPMMTLIDEEYYFGLETGKSMTLLDEANITLFTDDELIQEFDELMNSGNKYVVMVDTLGRDALIRIGMFEELQEKYRHTLYDDKWYDAGLSIFYIE